MKYNLPFQKQALKVMALILLSSVLLEGISRAGDLYYKPLQQQVLRVAMGAATYACMQAETVKNEQAQRAAAASDPRIKTLQKRAATVQIALAVAQLGVLYLFSCFIVRVVQERSRTPTRLPG